MIYVFKTPFRTSKGRVLHPGDRVLLDDPDALDEIAQEVKKRIEAGDNDKPKRKRKKKIEDGDVQ